MDHVKEKYVSVLQDIRSLQESIDQKRKIKNRAGKKFYNDNIDKEFKMWKNGERLLDRSSTSKPPAPIHAEFIQLDRLNQIHSYWSPVDKLYNKLLYMTPTESANFDKLIVVVSQELQLMRRELQHKYNTISEPTTNRETTLYQLLCTSLEKSKELCQIVEYIKIAKTDINNCDENRLRILRLDEKLNGMDGKPKKSMPDYTEMKDNRKKKESRKKESRKKETKKEKRDRVDRNKPTAKNTVNKVKETKNTVNIKENKVKETVAPEEPLKILLGHASNVSLQPGDEPYVSYLDKEKLDKMVKFGEACKNGYVDEVYRFLSSQDGMLSLSDFYETVIDLGLQQSIIGKQYKITNLLKDYDSRIRD